MASEGLHLLKVEDIEQQSFFIIFLFPLIYIVVIFNRNISFTLNDIILINYYDITSQPIFIFIYYWNTSVNQSFILNSFN